MNNEPVAWIDKNTGKPRMEGFIQTDHDIPLYTQDQLEEARKLGMQQERAMWNLSASTQEIMDTHSVNELNDGGEPVKNATYWKRQYNLMATQNDNLKSGLYHANEQIKYLESHPAKELHLSLQKNKETGELLAVTYTDDEHRIVEVLWQRPPVKEFFEDEPQAKELHEIMQSNAELTDEEITEVINNIAYYGSIAKNDYVNFARAILRKAQEK